MRETERPEEAPEITPQVLHLRDLLKWVRQGRVRVPSFQRDFTWDRPRMLTLFWTRSSTSCVGLSRPHAVAPIG
jgi:hypothetical protein